MKGVKVFGLTIASILALLLLYKPTVLFSFISSVSEGQSPAIHSQEQKQSYKGGLMGLNIPSSLEKAHPRTYVTVYRYIGQQGAGVRSLASFQCFLRSLKLSFVIAEPEVENGSFWGYPGGNKLSFSDLFDIDLFNSRSREIDHPEMISMEEFIHHRPKYTIFI